MGSSCSLIDTVLKKYEIVFYFYMGFFGRKFRTHYFFFPIMLKFTYLSVNLEPLFLAKVLMWGFSKMVKLINN